MTEKIPVLLVVDDRPDNLFIIEQLVAEYIPTCIVHTASNADMAVKMALEYHPDGILSDIQMPGKNGIELCRQLKQIHQTSQIPVLLITAHTSDSNLRVQGLEAGADDFIPRPIDNLELAARIKVMFRIKHMQDQLITAKADLEKKVEERTKELSAMNKALIQEVKERTKAENHLREKEEMISLLLNSTAEGIYGIDKEGICVFCNPACLNLFGYQEKEELLGKNIHEIVHHTRENGSSCSFDECRSQRVLKGEKSFLNDNDVMWKADGSSFEVEYWCHPMKKNMDIIGEVISFVDISDRRKIEREKKDIEGRLNQAQKMEAIGTLAGGIAHDFNNILGVILGFSQMAKEDAPPGTKYQEDLDKVLSAANRAKDLVKQILAFSRQAQVDRIPMKMQPLIKEGLKMLRSSIPTTISITENIDPKSGTVLADPTQIHQILMNLCTNAYHAMETTGGELSVTLETTFIDTDDQTMLLQVTPGENIVLTVSDTGSGIGPDVIEKIFDPYFTTKEIGKGSGMGLAIIHGIMKEYGGAITVDSQLGKGSTFHVYIPVIQKDAIPEIKGSDDLPEGRERILFIDDEELLAEMGKDMLGRLGYHVTVRRSSIEALATFQNTPNDFDMVITDQTMPDMTGSDLARRMMQIRPDIPIILCTGYSNLIDEDSAKGLGIKEFALKPMTKGTISKLIRKVLDGQ
nr:response regulator [Desulfobulbaceae bacterium]